MNEEKTPRELMEAMPLGFQAQNAQNESAIIQYKLSGEGGGNWHITIDKGTCSVTEGVSDAAQATLMMEASDFVDLATGKLNGMTAFMSGKLKTGGNMGLLMKMQKWFKA